MIISKTPFRISFFGGGTDYPGWYLEHGGRVISTTINKYCYITIRSIPAFFEYNYRLRYFATEEVLSIDEIKHPAIRETFKFLEIKQNLELVHFAEMPAQSGLGSSSTFTVGLLKALHAFKGEQIWGNRLLKEALHVEQRLIKENVGSQDQAAASFGGFNSIEFKKDSSIIVEPLTISKKRVKDLEDRLILVFTGFSRTASIIAHEQIKNIPSRTKELYKMLDLANDAQEILMDSERPLDDFGYLLNKQWQLKKTMSNLISNQAIDLLYKRAISAGAIGGKLLGAGSGGFMLLYVPLNNKAELLNKLDDCTIVDFNFESDGPRIIHYKPE